MALRVKGLARTELDTLKSHKGGKNWTPQICPLTQYVRKHACACMRTRTHARTHEWTKQVKPLLTGGGCTLSFPGQLVEGGQFRLRNKTPFFNVWPLADLPPPQQVQCDADIKQAHRSRNRTEVRRDFTTYTKGHQEVFLRSNSMDKEESLHQILLKKTNPHARRMTLDL